MSWTYNSVHISHLDWQRNICCTTIPLYQHVSNNFYGIYRYLFQMCWISCCCDSPSTFYMRMESIIWDCQPILFLFKENCSKIVLKVPRYLNLYSFVRLHSFFNFFKESVINKCYPRKTNFQNIQSWADVLLRMISKMFIGDGQFHIFTLLLNYLYIIIYIFLR